jgi:hypothetical protein
MNAYSPIKIKAFTTKRNSGSCWIQLREIDSSKFNRQKGNKTKES